MSYYSNPYRNEPRNVPRDFIGDDSNRFPMTPISSGQQSPGVFSYLGFGSNPQQPVTPIVTYLQQLIESGVERRQAQKASDFINKYLRLKTGIQNLGTPLTPPEISDLTIELIKDDTSGTGSRMGSGRMGSNENTPLRLSGGGGKRRHRTRGRHQRGGYSMSTFSNDAAPITGGRRKSRRHRRRTHKKHGKKSRRR